MPFVYFIGAGEARDPVKIGFATDPQARLSQLQVSHWMQLHLIASVPGNAGLERALHDRFNDDRLSGEWFRRTPRLDSAIAALVRGDTATALDKRTGTELLVAWIGGSGMTRATFAERIGVTKAAVTHLINRRSTPRTHIALRIAEITGGAVPVDCWAVRSHGNVTASSSAASAAALANVSTTTNEATF